MGIAFWNRFNYRSYSFGNLAVETNTKKVVDEPRRANKDIEILDQLTQF